jgi:2-O-methyltransferase
VSSLFKFRPLIERVSIKSRTLANEWLFEHLGMPAIKGEKISKSRLKQYLPRHPIIIDCGAHDGSDSILLAKVLGGEVHAFEPVPRIYQRLVKNTTNAPIRCYPVALSDTCGTAQFYISGGTSDASSSLLAPKEHLLDHPTVSFEEQLTVETVTLDHWAQRHNIQEVHLLWLDMQGAELQMLETSQSILPTVRVIHSEVSTKETYEGTRTYDHLRTFLIAHGFTVVMEAIPPGADMGNVVFARL